MRRTPGSDRSGHAVVEVALMAPWLLLMFLAIFNFGFFMYAGISVSNATRSAALEMARKTITKDSATMACAIVKKELEYLPNAGSFPANCNSAPLVIAVANACEAGTTGISPAKTCLRVTYTSIQLFPLPWLRGQLTLSRKAEVRVYQ